MKVQAESMALQIRSSATTAFNYWQGNGKAKYETAVWVFQGHKCLRILRFSDRELHDQAHFDCHANSFKIP